MITSAFGKRLREEIERPCRDPIGESRGRDLPFGDGGGGRKVQRRASQVRVPPGHEHGQLAGRTADVTEGPITREIELLGEGLKIARGDAAHRIHELLEPLGLAVELGEHGRAGVLDLVLRVAGPESLGEVAPESVQAGVGHFQEAAHELRAVPIEEQGGFRRIAISRFRAIAVALEKAKRHQRVEEIGIGSRVQPKRRLQLARRSWQWTRAR